MTRSSFLRFPAAHDFTEPEAARPRRGWRARGGRCSDTIGLSDFALPIFDADWEAEHGLPEGAQRLKALLAGHQALLIATPEHNGGYTALLENALDWMGRPNGFPSGKVAALDLSLSRTVRRREIPAILANCAHQAWCTCDS
jgi:hypothetical protein